MWLGLRSQTTDCSQERLERSASPGLGLRLQNDGWSLSGIARQLLEQHSLKAVASLGCRGRRTTVRSRRSCLAKSRESREKKGGTSEGCEGPFTRAGHEITPSVSASLKVFSLGPRCQQSSITSRVGLKPQYISIELLNRDDKPKS
jgi:hypothetical protein